MPASASRSANQTPAEGGLERHLRRSVVQFSEHPEQPVRASADALAEDRLPFLIQATTCAVLRAGPLRRRP